MTLTTNEAFSEASDDADDRPSPGALYVPPCFTSAAFEAERDPSRVPMFIPQEQSWLAPLLDAIGSPVFPDSNRQAALWHTEWGQDGRERNSQEHEAYLVYVKQFTSQRMPWLIPLLDGARAIVAVQPGSYMFCVDNYLGATFEIRELIPYTHLLPWATDDERKRAH